MLPLPFEQLKQKLLWNNLGAWPPGPVGLAGRTWDVFFFHKMPWGSEDELLKITKPRNEGNLCMHGFTHRSYGLPPAQKSTWEKKMPNSRNTSQVSYLQLWQGSTHMILQHRDHSRASFILTPRNVGTLEGQADLTRNAGIARKIGTENSHGTDIFSNLKLRSRTCRCFRKFGGNTPKWSFLVGKPMVVGETHHFRKPPCIQPLPNPNSTPPYDIWSASWMPILRAWSLSLQLLKQ